MKNVVATAYPYCSSSGKGMVSVVVDIAEFACLKARTVGMLDVVQKTDEVQPSSSMVDGVMTGLCMMAVWRSMISKWRLCWWRSRWIY